MVERRVNRVHYRDTHHLCPSCYSRLETNSLGQKVCSEENLKYWNKELELYNTLPSIEKMKYLQTITCSDKFKFLADSGNKFECDFSNKINPVGRSTTSSIPDPLIVLQLEQKLNRVLTNQELDEIPSIAFPEEG